MKNNSNLSVQKAPVSEERFAVAKKNIMWILVGLFIMVIGYILMIGGGTKDPDVFTGEQLFSFRRIVLAPTLIFIGFVFEIWAIMYKKRAK